MSTIVVAGRCGEKIEMKQTKGGEVLKFSVAENTYENGQKGTRWWDASFFGKRGESLSKVLSKGSAVSVTGGFSTYESKEGKTYFQVNAYDVVLLGGGERREEERGSVRRDDTGAKSDDIPF